MGTALGQRHDPSLRKGRLLTLVHPGTAEVLRVRGRVSHIETRPVNRDQTTSRQPHPRRIHTTDRSCHPPEQRSQRLRTQPLPSLEDRRLARRRCSSPATPTPTTAHRSTGTTRPHTSPPSTAPSRSRNTPSPEPATPDDAAQSDQPERSPHQPAPAERPASTPPPTPDPTTDDPTPASSNPLAACHQTTPM